MEAPVKEREYTSAETAELLRVARPTVHAWIREGKMEARKAGLGETAPYMISETELLRIADLLGLNIEAELKQLER